MLLFTFNNERSRAWASVRRTLSTANLETDPYPTRVIVLASNGCAATARARPSLRTALGFGAASSERHRRG